MAAVFERTCHSRLWFLCGDPRAASPGEALQRAKKAGAAVLPARPQKRTSGLPKPNTTWVGAGVGPEKIGKAEHSAVIWRREWDSNPRYGFPYTRFPSERLQPLGHP